jgi:hypothetical protein
MPSGSGNKPKLFGGIASRKYWITILAISAAVGIPAALLIDPHPYNSYVVGRRTDKLIGEWRTEPIGWNHPMNTNHYEFYSAVTFSKNGAFKIQNFITSKPRTEVPIPWSGTYIVLDAKHLWLELVPNEAFPADKSSHTVTYALVGDELTLPTLVPSVVTEWVKYRKVKD